MRILLSIAVAALLLGGMISPVSSAPNPPAPPSSPQAPSSPTGGLTEDVLSQVGEATRAAGQRRDADLVEITGLIIRAALGLLGVVGLVLVIYGGGLWMTSRGNDEQVKKARGTLIAGIIGLIIIVLAYAVTTLVFRLLLDASGLNA